MIPRNSNWTQEEKDFLVENWGVLSIATIAKKLNRTEFAVCTKKNKMKLGPFLESSDYVSAKQLFETLGYYGDIIRNPVWKNNGFPMISKKIKTRSFKCVRIKDFWPWAQKHQDLLDFSNFEQYSLGKEPEWVNKKRIQDRNKLKFKTEPWTQKEDEYLTFLVNEYKYTCKDISRMMRRTEGAVQRRLVALNVLARPLPQKRKKWTEEEIAKLNGLILKGYDYIEISEEFSYRSISSIEAKVRKIYNTKDLKIVKKMIEEVA